MHGIHGPPRQVRDLASGLFDENHSGSDVPRGPASHQGGGGTTGGGEGQVGGEGAQATDLPGPARGEVVVVNEKFGVRLTDVITPIDRVKSLAAEE